MPTMRHGSPNTTHDCMGAKERAGLTTQGGAVPTIGDVGRLPFGQVHMV